jgi:hypothetical protein
MRPFRLLVLATAAAGGVLLAPAVASAHDLRARVTLAAAVKLEAFFDDDTPAELADVRVTDAGGAEVLAGKTDDRGVWTFPRPNPGRYTATVKSAGHVAKVEFPVEGDPEAPPAVYAPWRMNKALGLAIGLVLLLGLSAASWLIRRRRRC